MNVRTPETEFNIAGTDSNTAIRALTKHILDMQIAKHFLGKDSQHEKVKTARYSILQLIGSAPTWTTLTTFLQGIGKELHLFIVRDKLDIQYQQARLTVLPQMRAELPHHLTEKLSEEDIALAWQAANELSFILKNEIHPMRFFVMILDIENGGLVNELNAQGQRGSYTHPVFSIALQFADKNLQPISPAKEWVIHHPEEVLKSIHPYVQNMHEESGLFKRVRESKLTMDKMEGELLMYLHEHNIPRHNFKTNTFTVVAGNSVYTDWEHMTTKFPRFTKHFNYQLLDMSALQMMNKMTGLPVKTTVKAYNHTALEDIGESLREGQEFLAAFKLLKGM